jgi:hypothetical protein
LWRGKDLLDAFFVARGHLGHTEDQGAVGVGGEVVDDVVDDDDGFFDLDGGSRSLLFLLRLSLPPLTRATLRAALPA